MVLVVTMVMGGRLVAGGGGDGDGGDWWFHSRARCFRRQTRPLADGRQIKIAQSNASKSKKIQIGVYPDEPYVKTIFQSRTRIV